MLVEINLRRLEHSRSIVHYDGLRFGCMGACETVPRKALGFWLRAMSASYLDLGFGHKKPGTSTIWAGQQHEMIISNRHAHASIQQRTCCSSNLLSVNICIEACAFSETWEILI